MAPANERLRNGDPPSRQGSTLADTEASYEQQDLLSNRGSSVPWRMLEIRVHLLQNPLPFARPGIGLSAR